LAGSVRDILFYKDIIIFYIVFIKNHLKNF